MKRMVTALLCLCLCMVWLTACGQRPEPPESSVPADVSTTSTTEETTTTTTTEETTTSAEEITTTSDRVTTAVITTTTTTEKSTTTTTVKPTTTTTPKPVTTTTTTTTTTTEPTTTTSTITTTTMVTTTKTPHCSTRKRTTTAVSAEIEEAELPSFDETVRATMYRLNLDQFRAFLEEPSMGRLKQGIGEEIVYYVQLQGGYKCINNKVTSLVKSKEVLTQYLANQGINETPLGAVSFSYPGSTLIIWVTTEQQNLFIVVDCHSGAQRTTLRLEEMENYYTFTLYTEAEFAEKYAVREVPLYVDAALVETQLSVLCSGQTALLPLTDVLVACGAVITKESDTQREFFLNGEYLLLDLKEKELYQWREDMVGVQGETIGWDAIWFSSQLNVGRIPEYYYLDEDLVIESTCLSYIFRCVNLRTTSIYTSKTGIYIKCGDEGNDSTS